VRFIVDTTILSALMKSEPAPSRQLLQTDPSDVFVPGPVVAEIRYGIARLARSKRKALLEERLATLLRAVERAPWTDDVSSHFGATKAQLERRGSRLDDFDIAIAAHALAIDATIVTRNLNTTAVDRS
jgi:tRNA(fMet)-specific endonuclease VapC